MLSARVSPVGSRGSLQHTMTLAASCPSSKSQRQQEASDLISGRIGADLNLIADILGPPCRSARGRHQRQSVERLTAVRYPSWVLYCF